MIIIPIELSEANEFVRQHHRHHRPVIGHKFSIGLSDGATVRGVAIIGRPVSRHLDNGWTLEVTRCCTDGIKNGCSKLYAAAWRATKALGYTKLITYTMQNERGASLRAAGWTCIGEAGGGNWNVPSRPRVDTDHQQTKIRWEATNGISDSERNEADVHISRKQPRLNLKDGRKVIVPTGWLAVEIEGLPEWVL